MDKESSVQKSLKPLYSIKFQLFITFLGSILLYTYDRSEFFSNESVGVTLVQIGLFLFVSYIFSCLTFGTLSMIIYSFKVFPKNVPSVIAFAFTIYLFTSYEIKRGVFLDPENLIYDISYIWLWSFVVGYFLIGIMFEEATEHIINKIKRR